MKSKRTVIFIGAFTVTTIGISSSAYALEISNPLAALLDQWQEQTRSVNKYISSTISQKLDDLSESLQGDLQAVVSEATGVLGLPDASEVRSEVEVRASDSDNAVNSVDKATNEVDRQCGSF